MNHPEDLVQAVGDILEHLYTAQIQFRDTFLTDWEACCAAANDFLRMGELLENILTKHLLLWSQDDNNNTQTAALEQKTAMLLGLYSRDAVFAAQTIHSFIMTTIEEAISEDLFGKAWLHDFTENQFAWTIVRTVEDYFEDLQLCLDGTLLEKAFESLVQSSVILYSKCLVAMSSKQLNIKKSVWKDNTEALDRIAGDISVIKHFFESLATESPIYPTLARTIEDQFGLLEILHEVLSITAGISSAALQDFVPLLHRRFKNLDLTKRVVGDLIHVVHPPSEKKAYKIVDSILNELGALVANDDTWHGLLGGRDLVSGLCLEDELTRICIENDKTRIRPGLKTANMSGKDPTEVMLHMWSKRSIHYRKKATKSIKKNLSVAGTSARVSVAKSFSKISFSDTTKSVPKKVSTGSNSNLTRDQQNAKEAQQSIAARIAMYKAKY